MPIPVLLKGRLTIPAICAPMFLISGPELVYACCTAGMVGSFPALNARSSSKLDEWLTILNLDLKKYQCESPCTPCAPFAVNLILHPSNVRREADLQILIQHRVPLIITSLGNPSKIVDATRSYGGLVFSDVIHSTHARKAIDSGADGIIVVANGAGGHAGTQSAFSLVREIREFWDGPLVLGGAISDGAALRAAEVLGADLGYIGTRFIASDESLATEAYKKKLIEATVEDIVYTSEVSGTPANFLRATLIQDKGETPPRPWLEAWSAGHGVALIKDIVPASTLVRRLAAEYHKACQLPISNACY
jgi:nitronate monooxygenase